MQLELPTIQNWNCHNCSGCCKQHLIEVTEEERQRIIKQKWEEDGFLSAGQQVLVPTSAMPWNKQFRLAHTADESCIFLNEQGLCRIHAKFGEAAKPLPCRIYPYVFHPAGKKVAVSLRYSCPSVVANLGEAVSAQSKEIKRIGKLVVPEGIEDDLPPDVHPGETVDWNDFRRIVRALDETIAQPDVPFIVRLLRALFWIEILSQSQLEKISGARLDDFLDLIRDATVSEVPELTEFDPPGKIGRMHFRMLTASYTRRDTVANLSTGWRGRWKLLTSILSFTRGKGNVPVMQGCFQSVPFALLEEPFGELPPEAEKLFSRYFRVKIQGFHFCGRGYYNVPLVEGFQSLALIYPVVLWISRWRAASDGRKQLTMEDITQALSIADHHHGFSAAFGQSTSRNRIKQLAKLHDIAKLCVWYSR